MLQNDIKKVGIENYAYVKIDSENKQIQAKDRKRINWHIHCQFIWSISKYRKCFYTKSFSTSFSFWVEMIKRRYDVAFTTAYITRSFWTFFLFGMFSTKLKMRKRFVLFRSFAHPPQNLFMKTMEAVNHLLWILIEFCLQSHHRATTPATMATMGWFKLSVWSHCLVC